MGFRSRFRTQLVRILVVGEININTYEEWALLTGKLAYNRQTVTVPLAWAAILQGNKRRYGLLLPNPLNIVLQVAFSDRGPGGPDFLQSNPNRIFTYRELGPLITLPLWVQVSAAPPTIEVTEIYWTGGL